jgi:hypothetical protein
MGEDNKLHEIFKMLSKQNESRPVSVAVGKRCKFKSKLIQFSEVYQGIITVFAVLKA